MKAPDCSIAKPRTAARPGKYLTFVLGGETCAINILQVREILRPGAITPVPRAPAYIRGVINLRGKIVPVLDLRAKFGMSAAASHERSCLVVVQARMNELAGAPAGLLVDAVEEVIQLAEKDVEPPPEFGGRAETRCMLGLAKTGDSVKILLDVDEIMAGGALL